MQTAVFWTQTASGDLQHVLGTLRAFWRSQVDLTCGAVAQRAPRLGFSDRKTVVISNTFRTVLLAFPLAVSRVVVVRLYGGITSQAIPADWDQDGLIDLICHMGPSNTNCQPMFARNIGTKTDPRFDHPRPLALWGEPLFNLMKHGPYWAIHDFDSDGRHDLLAGCAYGNYAFYCRTAMDLPARPSFEIGRTRMLKPESRK